MLGDLLDPLHTLTRLKSVPALCDSPEPPEAERVRGGAIAAQVSMPALARAWEMLLKGIAEVEPHPTAVPRRRWCCRLCYVADLPARPICTESIGGLVCCGTNSGAAAACGRGCEACRGGAVIALHGPRRIRSSARRWHWWPSSERHCCTRTYCTQWTWWIRASGDRDAGGTGDAAIGGAVRGVAERGNGTRWTIALSTVEGEPTLAAQGSAADSADGWRPRIIRWSAPSSPPFRCRWTPCTMRGWTPMDFRRNRICLTSPRPTRNPWTYRVQTNEEPRRPDEAGSGNAGTHAGDAGEAGNHGDRGIIRRGHGLRRAEWEGRVRRIVLDPKIVDPSDVEMLQDLIIAAHADASGRWKCTARGRCRS